MGDKNWGEWENYVLKKLDNLHESIEKRDERFSIFSEKLIKIEVQLDDVKKDIGSKFEDIYKKFDGIKTKSNGKKGKLAKLEEIPMYVYLIAFGVLAFGGPEAKTALVSLVKLLLGGA